jgi:hypothetical protein
MKAVCGDFKKRAALAGSPLLSFRTSETRQAPEKNGSSAKNWNEIAGYLESVPFGGAEFNSGGKGGITSDAACGV